jgi:hypothetical protein
VLKSGGVEVIVNALAQFTKDQSLCRIATKALYHVVFSAGRATPTEPGCGTALTLWALHLGKRATLRIMECGGIPVVLDALRMFPNDAVVRWAAASLCRLLIQCGGPHSTQQPSSRFLAIIRSF